MENQRRGRVGVREVAAVAGVSLGTVSHYLNTPSRVSPERAERIQAAIDSLGFVRNDAAGQLRNGRTGVIGYLAPEVGTPYFGVIAEGIERAAEAAGYSVIIASSHGDPQRERDYLAMFERNRVEGILVAARSDVEQELAAIRSRGIPSVLVSAHTRNPEQASVGVDDRLGGELVGKHLVEGGRRRFAFVGGPFSIHQVADRFAGLQAATEGISGASIEVIDTPQRSVEDGHSIGLQLAARPAHLRPDAVFAVNDLIALGLMQSLVREHRIRVPEEIAIVGYDDVPLAAASIIPLTSVRATQVGYGEAAVELLLAEINRTAQAPASPANQLMFQPALHIRASSQVSQD